MRLFPIYAALFSLVALAPCRARADAAHLRKDVAHDGKAHLTWADEHRKRWRKDLVHRPHDDKAQADKLSQR